MGKYHGIQDHVLCWKLKNEMKSFEEWFLVYVYGCGNLRAAEGWVGGRLHKVKVLSTLYSVCTILLRFKLK